jgi:hypothetical protein
VTAAGLSLLAACLVVALVVRRRAGLAAAPAMGVASGGASSAGASSAGAAAAAAH